MKNLEEYYIGQRVIWVPNGMFEKTDDGGSYYTGTIVDWREPATIAWKTEIVIAWDFGATGSAYMENLMPESVDIAIGRCGACGNVVYDNDYLCCICRGALDFYGPARLHS